MQRWDSPSLAGFIRSTQARFSLSDSYTSYLAILLWVIYVRNTVLSTGWPENGWLLHNVENLGPFGRSVAGKDRRRRPCQSRHLPSYRQPVIRRAKTTATYLLSGNAPSRQPTRHGIGLTRQH